MSTTTFWILFALIAAIVLVGAVNYVRRRRSAYLAYSALSLALLYASWVHHFFPTHLVP